MDSRGKLLSLKLVGRAGPIWGNLLILLCTMLISAAVTLAARLRTRMLQRITIYLRSNLVQPNVHA